MSDILCSVWSLHPLRCLLEFSLGTPASNTCPKVDRFLCESVSGNEVATGISSSFKPWPSVGATWEMTNEHMDIWQKVPDCICSWNQRTVVCHLRTSCSPSEEASDFLSPVSISISSSIRYSQTIFPGYVFPACLTYALYSEIIHQSVETYFQ